MSPAPEVTPPPLLPRQGFVVGFTGSKVFVLWNYAMRSIDVLQSAPMYQYIEKKLFRYVL